MASSGAQHRIDEIKEVFNEIKENMGGGVPNRIKKDSVLLEICSPGTCGYDGCTRSARNRESELLARIEELESTIVGLNGEGNGNNQGHGGDIKEPEDVVEGRDSEMQAARSKLFKAVSMGEELRKENMELRSDLDRCRKEVQRLEGIEKECLEHRETLSRLRNEIIDLKGRVRVICRIRPGLAGRQGARIEVSDRTLMIDGNNKKHLFSVDSVAGPSATQECIYEEIEMVVRSVLDGYKACVFAYGQTGSGKTYTMEGDDADPGLIIRALDDIYKSAREMEPEGWRLESFCSYVEIYNEEIVDLLSGDAEKVSVVHGGMDVGVASCTTVPIHNVSDAIRLFRNAAGRRRVGDTACNLKSSRSHAVYILRVRMNNEVLKERKEGVMVLTDLAGSERLSVSKAEGARLKETQSINKSLSALGDVFNSILRGDAHIPFRNSKLTHLLQGFLSGGSRTVVLVNISPDADHLNETICSMRFADKVGRCKLEPVTRKITKVVSE